MAARGYKIPVRYRAVNAPYAMPRPAKRARTTTTTTVRSIPYPPSPMAVVSDSNSRGLNRRGVASRETGFVDVALTGYAFDTTGSIALLNTVAQGASVSQRVGKKIILKSLQCHGTANSGATTTIADITYIIVYDKRPTGALPAITDILNTANSNSFNNDVNSGRFKILKRVDDCMTGNNVTPATGNEARDTSFYLKLRGLPTVYKALGTGVIGDIEEGALYLVTVGSVVAGPTAAGLTAGFRLRFIDV